MAPAQETESAPIPPIRLFAFVTHPDDRNLRGFDIKDPALLEQASTFVQAQKWPEVFAGDLVGTGVALPDSEMQKLFPSPPTPAATPEATAPDSSIASPPATPAVDPASSGTTSQAASTSPTKKAAPPDTAKGDSSPPAGSTAPPAATAPAPAGDKPAAATK